jgi:hypothetical protein
MPGRLAGRFDRCEAQGMRSVAVLAVLVVVALLPACAVVPRMTPVDGATVPPPPVGKVAPPLPLAPEEPPQNHTLAGSILIGLAIAQVPWIVGSAVLAYQGEHSNSDVGPNPMPYVVLGASANLAFIFLAVGLPDYLLGHNTPEEKANRERLRSHPAVTPTAGAHGFTGGTLGLAGTS